MSKSFWFFLAMLLIGGTQAASTARAGDQYGYNEGFFLSSADDDFMVKMNAHFVGRYTGVVLDGAGAANTSTFSVPFSRFYFSGHAFGPEWTYMMSFELATGAVAARDYYVNWMHCDMFNLKVGNFKVPYGFEFLVNDYHQQFATNSIVTTAGGFIPGREIGLSLWGMLGESKKAAYWLSVTNGLANGTGANATQTAGDIDFRYTGRLTYYAAGNHGFWMSDLGKSEEAQLALSVGGNWNRVDNDADLTFDNNFGVSVDAQYAMGGMSAVAEYHMLSAEAAAADITNHGVNAQVGYFFNDNNELAARFSWLEPDVGARNIQPGVVWNWYLKGHNAKVQVEYDVNMRQDVPVGLTTDDFVDHMGMVQLQFFI